MGGAPGCHGDPASSPTELLVINWEYWEGVEQGAPPAGHTTHCRSVRIHMETLSVKDDAAAMRAEEEEEEEQS